jgi:hypothetical protein
MIFHFWSKKVKPLQILWYFGAIHKMAKGREDKEFQQFDWWRAEVCPLGLHARGRRPKENALESAYMAALFERFGAKSFSSQLRVWARQEW